MNDYERLRTITNDYERLRTITNDYERMIKIIVDENYHEFNLRSIDTFQFKFHRDVNQFKLIKILHLSLNLS
jgi:hypothetical protein